MSQERVTDQEKVLVFTWKSALMNHEITLSLITFVEILLWVDFKDIITHLKADWLDFGGNILAWLLNMTEGLISFTVKFWKSCGPFFSNFVKNIRRNR